MLKERVIWFARGMKRKSLSSLISHYRNGQNVAEWNGDAPYGKVFVRINYKDGEWFVKKVTSTHSYDNEEGDVNFTLYHHKNGTWETEGHGTYGCFDSDGNFYPQDTYDKIITSEMNSSFPDLELEPIFTHLYDGEDKRIEDSFQDALINRAPCYWDEFQKQYKRRK